MKQAGRDMRLKGIYNEKEILYNEFVPYRRETEYPADVRESGMASSASRLQRRQKYGKRGWWMDSA